MKTKGKKKTLALNVAFICCTAAILIFLLKAPEETTSPLPQDENHQEFFAIASKKEAEKGCTSCHDDGGMAPLPEEHPPKYRCLFCHKRN